MAKHSLLQEPVPSSSRRARAGQDPLYNTKGIRNIRRTVWEEWGCKGTSGRVMRELSSLTGRKWLSRKPRREGSYTSKAYTQAEVEKIPSHTQEIPGKLE